MKIGFYDSGLGGLSVLREFIKAYGSRYEYYYFGDSARAPYGERSKEELKTFTIEILDKMQEEEIDLVISACNTTSMLLHEIDLEDYLFETMGLFEVMQDYFNNDLKASLLKDLQTPIALLATSSNIDMGRYKDWGMNIIPVKCPELVPLIEAGKPDEAKVIWQTKLNNLDKTIKHVIIGCTHYSFLYDPNNAFEFIDPAKLCVKNFNKTIYSDKLLNFSSKKEKLSLEIEFSKTSDEYLKLVDYLLSL
jgi:glutamate racemase